MTAFSANRSYIHEVIIGPQRPRSVTLCKYRWIFGSSGGLHCDAVFATSICMHRTPRRPSRAARWPGDEASASSGTPWKKSPATIWQRSATPAARRTPAAAAASPAGSVEQDAAQMAVRLQDGRQQRALAAADVSHGPHRREVVAGARRSAGERRGPLRHRGLELCAPAPDARA